MGGLWAGLPGKGIQPGEAVLLRGNMACPFVPFEPEGSCLSLPSLSPGLEAQPKRRQFRPGAAVPRSEVYQLP